MVQPPVQNQVGKLWATLGPEACQGFSLPNEGRVTVKREKLCRVDGQIVTRHGAESVLLMNTDHLKAKRLTHRGKGMLRLGISDGIPVTEAYDWVQSQTCIMS